MSIKLKSLPKGSSLRPIVSWRLMDLAVKAKFQEFKKEKRVEELNKLNKEPIHHAQSVRPVRAAFGNVSPKDYVLTFLVTVLKMTGKMTEIFSKLNTEFQLRLMGAALYFDVRSWMKSRYDNILSEYTFSEEEAYVRRRVSFMDDDGNWVQREIAYGFKNAIEKWKTLHPLSKVLDPNCPECQKHLHNLAYMDMRAACEETMNAQWIDELNRFFLWKDETEDVSVPWGCGKEPFKVVVTKAEDIFNELGNLYRIMKIFESVEETEPLLDGEVLPLANLAGAKRKSRKAGYAEPHNSDDASSIPAAWMADKETKRKAKVAQTKAERKDNPSLSGESAFGRDHDSIAIKYYDAVYPNFGRNWKVKDSESADDIMDVQLWNKHFQQQRYAGARPSYAHKVMRNWKEEYQIINTVDDNGNDISKLVMRKHDCFRSVAQGGLGTNNVQFMDFRANQARLNGEGQGWHTAFSEMIGDPQGLIDIAYYAIAHHDAMKSDHDVTKKARKLSNAARWWPGDERSKPEPIALVQWVSNMVHHRPISGTFYNGNIVRSGPDMVDHDLEFTSRYVTRMVKDQRNGIDYHVFETWLTIPVKYLGSLMNQKHSVLWMPCEYVAFKIGRLWFNPMTKQVGHVDHDEGIDKVKDMFFDGIEGGKIAEIFAVNRYIEKYCPSIKFNAYKAEKAYKQPDLGDSHLSEGNAIKMELLMQPCPRFELAYLCDCCWIPKPKRWACDCLDCVQLRNTPDSKFSKNGYGAPKWTRKKAK